MNGTTRRIVVAATTCLATLVLALMPSIAHANDSWDVSDVWLTAQDVRVNSGACGTAPMKMHHNGGYLDRIAADVEIWKGPRYVGETFDYLYDSSAPLTVEHLWCSFEGLGRFTAGPSKVEWSYTVETSYWDSDLQMWLTDTDHREGELRDSSRTSFTVKQASRLSKPSVRRSGRTRTLSTKLSHYNVETSSWKAMKKTRVKLQRRAGNGRGPWKTIKTVRTSSSGRATSSVKAARKFQYRFVYGGSGTTWNRTSVVVRR